mgnify:CR=1 FL=1
MLEIQDLKWNLPSGDGIINGVSFKTNGGLTVITGPNGGGKTTLAKLIAGVEIPTEGKILLDGEDITSLSVTERAKKGVAYAFQQPVRFKGLTVRDLLELVCLSLPRAKTLNIPRFASFSGKSGFARRNISTAR